MGILFQAGRAQKQQDALGDGALNGFGKSVSTIVCSADVVDVEFFSVIHAFEIESNVLQRDAACSVLFAM